MKKTFPVLDPNAPVEDTVFDVCDDMAAIDGKLQALARELISEAETEQPGLARLQDRQAVDLEVLSRFSYAELRHHRRPVHTLSEICRLLVKKGDARSFQLVLKLSHRLYSVKCKLKQSWYLSFLYKGAAQIGLNLTDAGVKNVLFGMYKHTGYSLVPVDRILGYWALTSASIQIKNLKNAATFADDWRRAAEDGGMDGSAFQARLAMQVFHLLFGDKTACNQGMAEMPEPPTEAWKDARRFLADWTDIATRAQCGEPRGFATPHPLFIGVPWPSDAPEPGPMDDFKALCRIRRQYCTDETIQRLDAADMESCAHVMAKWDLAAPLKGFERMLEEKHRDVFHQFTMARLFGREIVQEMLLKPDAPADVTVRNGSLILFMDVRKYSEICETLSPEEVFTVFNPLFKIMNDELEKAGGTVLEFVGDCIAVVFNTFGEPRSAIADILFRAVNSIQKVRFHNALSLHTRLPEINVGIGINKGPVAVGYIGGLSRCTITVLGNAINLASRIESATKQHPGDILVSAACFDDAEPDIWKHPQAVNYAFRYVGYQKMKNIRRPVPLYALSPLLRYRVDFVPMGFVTEPEADVVYIDTGNSHKAGVIDHHCGTRDADSACELLLKRPELLLGHVEGTSAAELEFRLHTLPDLDCAATLYCAFELMDKAPRTAILEKLAAYNSLIDQGYVPDPDRLSDSLFGVFIAHQETTALTKGDPLTDHELLEAGLRVIDAAVYIMDTVRSDHDLASVFQFKPTWFAEERKLIAADRAIYEDDLAASRVYRAKVNGFTEPVLGLWMDHPRSRFFKLWARTDPKAPGGAGYRFLSVDLSTEEKRRFVISVPPESGTDLNGLGELLEAREYRRREALGKPRPENPPRMTTNNSDPWYFGWGHNFTIVDSPREGTILSAEEVREIHEGW